MSSSRCDGLNWHERTSTRAGPPPPAGAFRVRRPLAVCRVAAEVDITAPLA
jgi:hypothetical protein